MDPIEHLLRDHRAIMAELEPLRRAAAELRARRPGALEAALPALEAAARMMATRLLRHARKEDEALFPAVETALAGAGPTAVMREEHRAIHERAARFRETLRQLEEVEHPAIVAGGARLRALAAGPADAGVLAETAGEILELLDLHFGKEEDILFPMVREILSPTTRAEVAQRMEAIEAEAG